MAVILTQTATGTTTTGNTPVTWNSNTTTGNTIIVFVASSIVTAGNVSGITDSQGNSYQKVFANDGNSIDFEIWYATNIIGGTTPTITVAYTSALNSAAVVAREYWGLYAPAPLDTSNSSTGGSGNASSGNISLEQQVELLVGIAVCAASVTVSAGSGFVNLVTASSVTTQLAVEDQFVTSIGPWSANFTLTSNTGWGCGIAAFSQAPAGTTTSTSSTSISSTSTSISSTSSSTSSTSLSTSSTSGSTSMSSTSMSTSSTSSSVSSTSSSTSSTSISSTSSSTSISSTSSSISSTSTSSTSQSSTSSSTSISSTSTSFSSTSSSMSSTSHSTSSTSVSSTSSSSSTSTTTVPPPYWAYSYVDQTTLPSNNANLLELMNANEVSDVAADDGDYLIETGTGYIIKEFKQQHQNNTDTIYAQWKGRSTVATSRSPLYLQIYNQGVVIDSYSESNQDSATVLINTLTQSGESFTGNGSIATGAAFYLKVSGGLPTGTANVTISTHTGVFGGTSSPGTTLATSDNFNVSALTSQYQLIKFNFSGANQILLANGTNYFITFNWSNGSSTNKIAVGADISSPTAAGSHWDDSSGSSHAIGTIFYVYSVTPGWETLDYETTQPADKDFLLWGTQSTNLSNYYDSTNTVSFRIYQQVF